LSSVFLFLAWYDHLRPAGWAGLGDPEGIALVVAVRHVLMLLLDLFIGVTLLLGRRPVLLPQNLK
jgi:hypothetical protein